MNIYENHINRKKHRVNGKILLKTQDKSKVISAIVVFKDGCIKFRKNEPELEIFQNFLTQKIWNISPTESPLQDVQYEMISLD